MTRKNNAPKSGKELLSSWVSLSDDSPVIEKKDVPFLDDYVKENNPKLPILSEIQDVIFVKSGKGYLVVCEFFSVFVWKKSKLASILVEALTAYVQRGHGYVLAVVCTNLDQNGKPIFNIAANKELDEITYYLSEDSKKFSVYPMSSTEQYVNDTNPLL